MSSPRGIQIHHKGLSPNGGQLLRISSGMTCLIEQKPVRVIGVATHIVYLHSIVDRFPALNLITPTFDHGKLPEQSRM